VLDGTDAVMLSEESAVGHNPELAVQTMTNTIREIEKIYPYDKLGTFRHFDETDMIDESAVRLANDLGADAILAFTTSGQSAKKIARYRPRYPVYGVIHDEMIARFLTIVWGVLPAFYVKKESLEAMLAHVVKSGLEKEVLRLEGTYMLTAGDPVGVPGTTNSIRILRKNELAYFNRL
jgi:pyruvate kinase